MTVYHNPVLDWHPPNPLRQIDNEPYRLFRAEGVSSPQDVDLDDLPVSRNWTRRAWLNQGEEGACTGFALSHCLNIGRQSWPVSNKFAFERYRRARQFDEWHGEDYEGSSVLGACEGAKADGIIKAYHWIKTPQEFKAALARYGSLDLGTWWLSGMWNTDSAGFVHATGSREGGHSYSVGAQDLRRNVARIDNSWGESWGQRGSALIDLDELFDLLFNQQGECALIRKKRYNPVVLRSEK